MRFALLLFLAVLFGSAFAESYSSAHEQVKQLFLSDEEPTTKDALWTAKELTFRKFRRKCAREWPDDYAMRVYCEEQQIEAFRKIRSSKSR